MARGKRGLTANEALALVDDDLPDGAALGIAAEMYGGDYDDFISALADEETNGADDEPRQRSNKKRPQKTLQCPGCKKWFASKFAQHMHAKAKDHPKL